MKQTSRMSRSRVVQGSRPRTVSSPSYGVSPRIALSAVVLPAPFGPMSPRMWPSSSRRFTPSRATVVPKALRRPRASMHAMASALLLRRFRLHGPVQELFHLQAEPLDRGLHPGPFLAEEPLPFALQQQAAHPAVDEHSQAAPGFDEPLVHQQLI